MRTEPRRRAANSAITRAPADPDYTRVHRRRAALHPESGGLASEGGGILWGRDRNRRGWH